MFDAPRDRLAVALDVAGLSGERELAASLAGGPGWFKVGSELFVAAGPEAVAVAREHARVFLDLKFHDIPHQVARSVGSAARLGVSLLTVHAGGGAEMLRAAREAAGEAAAAAGLERPLVVAVTVLTSLSPGDLKETGVGGSLGDQVARLVDLAVAAGVDGVVASPGEAAAVRARAGDDFRIVTPGIRPAGSPADDQARTADPASAIAAGADLLVVGRPVLRAADPAAAARALVGEIEAALGARRG